MSTPHPIPTIRALSDQQLEEHIDSIERADTVYRDGSSSVDWMAMRNRSEDGFRFYVECRRETARRRRPV